MNDSMSQIARPTVSRTVAAAFGQPARIASVMLCAALLCAPFAALAQVSVSDAWVRATVPQQKATGAFMQLTAQQDMRLIEARSPVAGIVELHKMEMIDNVMKMRQIPALDLPAGQAVALKPGGYHVMFFDLKAQVKAGDKVPLTLVVEGRDKQRSEIDVIAVARGMAATGHKMH